MRPLRRCSTCWRSQALAVVNVEKNAARLLSAYRLFGYNNKDVSRSPNCARSKALSSTSEEYFHARKVHRWAILRDAHIHVPRGPIDKLQ